MPFFTYAEAPIGQFTEKERGNYFEYSLNEEQVFEGYEFPHRVWVGGPGHGYRYALVRKTVAYIVIDEDEYGKPVTEKWQLSKHTPYEVLEVTNPELILDPSKPAYMIKTL